MDGKLVLSGNLKLLSPLLIGSGNNDSTDLDVILDSDGNPFITFTSFIGALKHHLKKNYKKDDDTAISDDDLNQLFGFAIGDDAKGSIIMGTDFFLCHPAKKTISTRDGIKIDLATGIVKPKAKYDYQVVERDNEFSFKLEAEYSEGTKNELLRYFATIIELLKENETDGAHVGLRIGAKTNNGLGKICLQKKNLFDYDFSEKDLVIKWLKREDPQKFNIPGDIEPFKRKEEDLIIDAYLDLKTSLIQRSYNDDPTMPDASHMQSQGKDILVGSGAKGAITARAKKILNTIWTDSDESKNDFMDKLFGFVYDPNDKREKKDAIKSKLQIEERILPKYIAELHARIKIDRFTGGTISGALFDSMPLFNINTNELARKTNLLDTDKEKCTRLTIRLKDCLEEEAGLMLLVLKDIWTGDLAIGGEKGIGRGVFNGLYAFIKYKTETIELSKGLENLSSLQKYVDALTKLAGVKNEK